MPPLSPRSSYRNSCPLYIIPSRTAPTEKAPAGGYNVRHADQPRPVEPPAGPVKRLVVIACLVLAAALGYRSMGGETTGTGTLTLAEPAPNPGQDAPLFAADREGGGSFELSEEGVYVLTFWSSSSLPFLTNKDSAEARPEFASLARAYADDGVSFAAVYVSSAPEDESDAPYAVLQDGRGVLASRYNVKRVPRLFLIENGEIRLVQNGFYPGNEQQLEEELAALLEEKAPRSANRE